jgi:hypothetical protein
VGNCGTSPHLCRNPDRFHDFFSCNPSAPGGKRVTANAVRTLRHVRHGNGNEFFGVGWQCAVSENSLAELPEGTFDLRSKASPQFAGGLH